MAKRSIMSWRMSWLSCYSNIVIAWPPCISSSFLSIILQAIIIHQRFCCWSNVFVVDPTLIFYQLIYVVLLFSFRVFWVNMQLTEINESQSPNDLAARAHHEDSRGWKRGKCFNCECDMNATCSLPTDSFCFWVTVHLMCSTKTLFFDVFPMQTRRTTGTICFQWG